MVPIRCDASLASLFLLPVLSIAKDGKDCIGGAFFLNILDPRGHVLIGTNEMDRFLCDTALRDFHASSRYSVLLQPEGMYRWIASHVDVDVVILFLRETGDTLTATLRRRASAAETRGFAHRVHKFVVLLQNGDPSNVRAAFSVLQEINRLRCVVVARRRRTLDVYTVLPRFEPGVRCAAPGPVMLLDTWILDAEVFLKNASVFPFEDPIDDFNGCEIRVGFAYSPPYTEKNQETGEVHGIEVNLMKLIAQKRNATLSFVQEAEDEEHTKASLHGNWTGILGQLDDGEVDVDVSGLAPHYLRFMHFSHTQAYAMDTVRCYVPRRSEISRWKYPVIIFQPMLWGWIAGSFAAAIAFFSFTLRHIGGGVCMMLWGIWLESEWSKVIRETLKRGKTRLGSTVITAVFFLWIVFAMHINSLYRGALAMAITKTLYYPMPRTVHDLRGTVLEVGISSFSANLLLNDPRYAFILQNHVICDDQYPCLERLAEDRKFAYIYSENFITFLTPAIFLDERGKSTVVPLPEKLYVYHVSMLLRQRSPLTKAMDTVIDGVLSGGFIDYWIRSMAYGQKLRYMGPPPKERRSTLTIPRLAGAFAVLAIGILGALCIFVLELVSCKIPCLQNPRSARSRRISARLSRQLRTP